MADPCLIVRVEVKDPKYKNMDWHKRVLTAYVYDMEKVQFMCGELEALARRVWPDATSIESTMEGSVKVSPSEPDEVKKPLFSFLGRKL